MKKRGLAGLLVFLLLLLPAFALGEGTACDLEAVSVYADAWDRAFDKVDLPISVALNRENPDSPCLVVSYDRAGTEQDEPGPGCDVYLGYFFAENALAVLIEGEDVAAPLSRVRFYLDDGMLEADYIYEWDAEDPGWFFLLSLDTCLKLAESGDAVMRLETERGYRYFSLFTAQEVEDEGFCVDLMAYCVYNALQYATPGQENYKNAELLPDEADSGADIISDLTMEPAHFSSDYYAIEQAAQSMFYVEIFDINGRITGTGSGFVAFDEHYFVTNHHIIEDTAYLIVYDDKHDDVGYKLTDLVAVSEQKDTAILVFEEGGRYDALPLDTESSLMRGQPVVVIGSPKGVKNTVSTGIISALTMDDGFRNIQFTAAISPGSSGGALFSDEGKVIGLVYSSLRGGENMNYAVNIREVVELKNGASGQTTSLIEYNHLGTTKAGGAAANQSLVIREAVPAAAGAFRAELFNGGDKTITQYKLYVASADVSKLPNLPELNLLTESELPAYIERLTFSQSIAPGETALSPDVAPTVASASSPIVYVGVKEIVLSDGTYVSWKLEDIAFTPVTLTAAKTPILVIPENAKTAWERTDAGQTSLRVELQNASSGELIAGYTLCYGTLDPSTSVGRLLLKTMEAEQVIIPGASALSEAVSLSAPAGKTVYVGIREVRLLNGAVIAYADDEIVFFQCAAE
ncbi:MAG: serine protease [Clostridia bacterium]|nr:serine protease [Clostridia bacterium]